MLFADSGIENINSAVDDTLFSACLERVLAQVDVAYSNSMIEAFWRSLKHQWLYLNSLDSIERLRVLVAFFVEEHNTQMPHSAFAGQTPDEMYFGTAVDLPAQLAAGPEQSAGGAPCCEPGDDLQRVQWSASQPSRITKSPMISALTLLRTLFYERSSHTAGQQSRLCRHIVGNVRRLE